MAIFSAQAASPQQRRLCQRREKRRLSPVASYDTTYSNSLAKPNAKIVAVSALVNAPVNDANHHDYKSIFKQGSIERVHFAKIRQELKTGSCLRKVDA